MAGTGGDVPSDAAGGEERSGSSGRRQEAGFTIFLDHIADADGADHWETRLYHAESGAETTLVDASPEQWVSWILERLAGKPAGDLGLPPKAPVAFVQLMGVEIVEIKLLESADIPSATLHEIRANVVVRLAGVAHVEREIGSRVLRGIAAAEPPSSARRSVPPS